jgi:hypothetical protein
MTRFSPLVLALALALALSASAAPRIAAHRVRSESSRRSPQQKIKPIPPTSCPPKETPLPPDSSCHQVTVTFNYDFARMPSCSSSVKKSCVLRFHVFDISASKTTPVELVSFDPSPGETQPQKGITRQSSCLLFANGKHELAVTAESDVGSQSAVDAAIVWITVSSPSGPCASNP